MSIMEQKMQEQLEGSLELQKELDITEMIRRDRDADEECRLDKLFDIGSLPFDGSALEATNIELEDNETFWSKVEAEAAHDLRVAQ